MFFSDAGVIVDDQAVMARIRIRIDGLTAGEEYTVIYPYGIETFEIGDDAGPGAAKGPGISMTRDIGLVEPLFFEGPLKGDIGPFLVPVDYAGGPFISDGGLTEEMVTGSPLNVPGRNTNVFRIEGPGVGLSYPDHPCADLRPISPNPITGTNDCAESFLFSVMGQIATNFGAAIDRATYTKENGGTFVNVWANTVEGQNLVASVDGGAALNLVEGELGNYFGRLSVPAGQIPQTVTVTNTSDVPASFESGPITSQLTIKDATYIVGQGLNLAVQSSNLVDTTDIKATLITGQATPIDFFLTDQGGGLATGVKNVPIGVLEEHPSIKVVVTSRQAATGEYAGSAEANVMVLGVPTSGGLMNGILAVAGFNQNVISDRRIVILNGSDSIGPLALSYSWSHDGPITGPKKIELINTTTNLPDSSSAQVGFATPLDLSDPDPNVSGKLTSTSP